MLSKEDVWERQGCGKEREADEGHEEFTHAPILECGMDTFRGRQNSAR